MGKPNLKQLCKLLADAAANGMKGAGAPDRVPYAKAESIIGRKFTASERAALKREWASAVDNWFETHYPPPVEERQSRKRR